ncbi:MAG TPA: hypothetical protein VMI75_10315, partial [Polyangiaceae bacterium]|nr:hypothetical protein [Polyangiaceae bacterium]
MGSCDSCPALDDACTDPGPGATAHTFATVYNFGTIGLCDGDGDALCDTLTAGGEEWFAYTSDGTLSFCTFDPEVQ